MYPIAGNMNQLNSGNAVNPPALPMKLPANRFIISLWKSVNLRSVPSIDSIAAMISQALFDRLNFFNIPISMNDNPANANISTQNSNNPPAVGNMSHLCNRIPDR